MYRLRQGTSLAGGKAPAMTGCAEGINTLCISPLTRGPGLKLGRYGNVAFYMRNRDGNVNSCRKEEVAP